MEYINKMKLALVALATAFTAAFGWLGWLVVMWTGCMALDYITGTMAACKQGQWASAVARDGLWHKAGMIMAVAVAAIADRLVALVLVGLPIVQLPAFCSGLLLALVLCWYIVTELGSIAENAAAMGAPLPAFLQKMLALLQSATDTAGDTLAGANKKEE